MMADIGRPEQQVGVIVGGDIDPESGRSLSVGQLQIALRAAHGNSYQRVPLDPGSVKSRNFDSLRDSNSQSRKWINGILTSPGPKGPRGALSRIFGLQELGILLAARRQRLNGPAPDRPLKAPGVWSVPHPSQASALYAGARRWVGLAAAVMLLLVGAVTVAGRVAAMVDPPPVVLAPSPRVSDLQFAGAAQAAILDYLSWDGTAAHAARTAALSRWGFGGSVGDGWDGSGQLNAESSVAIQRRYVGLAGRRSRATSKIRPRTARTSLVSANGAGW